LQHKKRVEDEEADNVAKAAEINEEEEEEDKIKA
jgi:hypothetical protein